MSRLVDLIGLSIFWALLSIPVITCGAASSALYYTVVKVFKYHNDRAFWLMWKHFRRNLLKTMPATLACVALGALIAVGYSIMYANASSSLGAVMFTAYYIVLIIPVGIVCYFFPIVARFDMPVGACVKSAAVLSIAHFPSTVIIVVFHVAAAIFTVESYTPVLITPVACALLSSALLERIFVKHISLEQRAVLEETTVEEIQELENRKKNKKNKK